MQKENFAHFLSSFSINLDNKLFGMLPWLVSLFHLIHVLPPPPFLHERIEKVTDKYLCGLEMKRNKLIIYSMFSIRRGIGVCIRTEISVIFTLTEREQFSDFCLKKHVTFLMLVYGYTVKISLQVSL